MFRKKSMEELNRLSAGEMRLAEKRPLIVILDDVRSMNNVGSVFRTCDAFAVQGLYLCGYTPVPPHRDIHKTALGATETVRWKHFPDVLNAVMEVKNNGYRVVAVEQVHGSMLLQQYVWDKRQKMALVFGNEVTGVHDSVLEAADDCIEIPQQGFKHSLNISVSAGVVLWEMVR